MLRELTNSKGKEESSQKQTHLHRDVMYDQDSSGEKVICF